MERNEQMIFPTLQPQTHAPELALPSPLIPSNNESAVETATKLDGQEARVQEQIMWFLKNELDRWTQRHLENRREIVDDLQRSQMKGKKVEREWNRATDTHTLLSRRVERMRADNELLREVVAQLQNISAEGPSAHTTASLTTIKDKLWEGILKIPPEKKRHITLIKKLTQTRFNSENDKHCALFDKFFQLHGIAPESEHHAHFELGTAGILGLQNLVYLTERYPVLATTWASENFPRFVQSGLKLTLLLTHILGLQDSDPNRAVILPHETLLKSFLRLLDHNKAFEELYCISYGLYMKAVRSASPNPLEQVEHEVIELLRNQPLNLSDLYHRAQLDLK